MDPVLQKLFTSMPPALKAAMDDEVERMVRADRASVTGMRMTVREELAKGEEGMSERTLWAQLTKVLIEAATSNPAAVASMLAISLLDHAKYELKDS